MSGSYSGQYARLIIALRLGSNPPPGTTFEVYLANIRGLAALINIAAPSFLVVGQNKIR